MIFTNEIIDITTLNNFEDIYKYHQRQKFKFICEKCGKEEIKTRARLKLPLFCKKCTRSDSQSNIDFSIVNKKREETKLKRYGNSHYVNGEKIKQSLMSKSDEEKKLIADKIKQTNLEKYGGHPAKREEQILKTKQTCLERYGVNACVQNEAIHQKMIQTNLEKYGVTNVFSNNEVKNKIKNTLLEKYGVDNPKKSKEISDKIKQTCLEKYGNECCLGNHDVRVKCQQKYLYHNVYFDSSWELYYFIYLTEHKIDFEYQPNISFKYLDTQYFPDFKVNNEYIEIKGNHFFENGKMINPYDRTLDYIYEAKHQCMLNNNVKILTENDLIDVFKYVDDKYTTDFVKLFKTDLPFPYPNITLTDTSDYGLIKHFHKSIYEANRYGYKSIIEVWNDKDLIEKCALNRLKYIGSCKPSDILQGFNVSKLCPKVSVFKPYLATELIKKHLSEFTTIFDPFSGFSGRMLGAINNNKHYIGNDISEKHIKESKNIVEYKHIENLVTLFNFDIFQMDKCEYECLFTCPPYGNKEKWNDTDVNLSCDEWIDICLNKFKCKKYLFVVDDTLKYKDYIVDTIQNKSHINENNEYIILIEK